MKAIVLNDYGDSSKLTLQNVPEPEPAAGEIKIKVAASSINPFDWKVRNGVFKAMFPLQFPAILGSSTSGEVVALGPGVTRFKVGDKVTGVGKQAFAEYVTAPAKQFTQVPAGVDLQAAAAIPGTALTGVQLIEEVVNAQKGQTILITGAVGSVGRSAVYAAKARGVQVIAGVRAKQLSEAKTLGASSLIALDDETAIAKLPMVDAVADTIGGPLVKTLTAKVKNGGVIASTVAPATGDPARSVTGKGMQSRPDGERLAGLVKAFASGELVLPIEKRFPLEQAVQAHQLAEQGGAGKVLLLPGASS